MLELVRGTLPEKIYFLKPRPYVLGRARTNDLCLNEPSISKVHARLAYNVGNKIVWYGLPMTLVADVIGIFALGVIWRFQVEKRKARDEVQV